MVDSNFFSDSCRDALQELLLIFALRHGFVYGISDYASNTVFLPFPSSFPPFLYGVSYTKGGKVR